MNIFFTSDHHFNHKNIIEYQNRPFHCLKDMEDFFISTWNKVVHPRDMVYHLGDFAFAKGRKNSNLIDNILKYLNGNKFLIRGNHDDKNVIRSKKWNKVKSLHEIKVDLGGVHKQKIVLCHYPLRSWPSMKHGSWMLHGHCHGSLKDIGGKIMDVGVDCNMFTPVHITDVAHYMESRKILKVDNHVRMDN